MGRFALLTRLVDEHTGEASDRPGGLPALKSSPVRGVGKQYALRAASGPALGKAGGCPDGLPALKYLAVSGVGQ